MNVLPIILTKLWMDEYPKCPVRDKTNTEESPCTGSRVKSEESLSASGYKVYYIVHNISLSSRELTSQMLHNVSIKYAYVVPYKMSTASL